MELLVRIRWRHVAPADLRFDVEHVPLGSRSARCGHRVLRCAVGASQPVYLERSAEQLPLDAPILDSGVVSGDTLRFELYGVDHVDRDSLSEAVSCDVTAGPRGRALVRAPARPSRGRSAGRQRRRASTTPRCRDHQLSIVVFDDLTTQLLPDPAAPTR